MLLNAEYTMIKAGDILSQKCRATCTHCGSEIETTQGNLRWSEDYGITKYDLEDCPRCR